MNLQNDPQAFAVMKFGIGQPVPRSEDPILVRGEGCYTDDVKLPDEAYAVIVRSRVPHGVIKAIHTSAARQLPGVLGVYTGADLAEYGTLKCIVPFKNRDGTPMKPPPRPSRSKSMPWPQWSGRRRPRVRARRSFTRKHLATLRSTTTTAIANRSRPLSPKPR